MNDTADIHAALVEMGLANPGDAISLRPLGGGVSCDVFVVDLPGRRVCVKRALAKLRVEADWRAPAERSEAEVAWIRLAAGIEPRWVPAILGEDPARHLFVMEFLPPENHPVWKTRLAEGHIDVDFAGKVGAALGRIHAATAGRSEIAAAFANDAQFHALRIEPYLLHSADKNADVAGIIRALADGVATARIALMHGDVSPKNILCGPEGPVFLDAETACYGDPAFDLAFCLNHLLLKSMWHPQWIRDYSASFFALSDSYRAAITWEDPAALESRACGLLAALLLARIDGKSPVEYITQARDKDFVRAHAKALLRSHRPELNLIAAGWAEAVGGYFASASSR